MVRAKSQEANARQPRCLPLYATRASEGTFTRKMLPAMSGGASRLCRRQREPEPARACFSAEQTARECKNAQFPGNAQQ